ncbi:phage terminase large subunit [Methylobacterium aquaticum]|uniref:Phage-related terminase n=1 Tax=Methylobacterium aquaticum TaxID=270351 RepID=A0A0C6FC15_9HYPH|nr:phage terminase large subunit [Methylobacterium aquaticum]BAQ44387.1 phage-related terminase [Methylobacterium aquaticum]
MLRLIRAEKAKREREAEAERVARDAERIRARCQTLAGFVREAWHVLEPNTPLVWNWHLDAICAHLEAVSYGRINRLLINVPPGSSKSLLTSVLWQAWEWGPLGRRSLRYLTTAFNDQPVTRDTRKCRDLILSDWYQQLWPEVRLVRAGETSFANSSTGTREGVPFGSLTSQRGDRLIIDDPHSVETAESAADRARTTRKFREGAINRLNDQERSAIVVVMQRLHEDDVSGTIIKLGMGFTHLMLPMEFEADRACRTPLFADPRTQDGELLDPVRFPPSAVEGLRLMGSYAYAGQYQQRPAPREGGLFQRHWFGIVRAAPAGCEWVRAWDLAASEAKAGKTSGQPAYTAGLLLGRSRDGQQFYVADVRRDRVSAGKLEEMLINTARQDAQAIGDVRISLPQDPGGAGKFQASYLVGKLIGFNARATPETGDKETRALPVSAQAEAGNITLVKGAWNEAFLDEVSSFPNGSFKDQVDALSRAFQELAGPSYGMLGVLD